MLFLSVIIPNLHTPTVGQAIEALEHQSFNHAQYEVIVVGMDRYCQIRTTSLVRFDQSERPLSPAQARNRGASQARGNVFVFTDADCVAASDWLSILANAFTNAATQVVGGGVEFDRDSYWTFSDNLSMFYENLAILPSGERTILPSLNLAIRRAVFIGAGGFDERYPRASGEDADLTLRLRRLGYTLYFEPRAVVRHAPPRHRMLDVARHGFYQGVYSTKVDPRYFQGSTLEGVAHHRISLLLLAPALATMTTARILVQRHLWAFWYTAPAIWIAKLAWCIGAACRPLGGKNWGKSGTPTKNETTGKD